MARCDQGYLCDVCGEEVEQIIDSDLYLRYVLGEISPEALPCARERHLRCNAAMAQFIVDPGFQPVECPGPFDKRLLDPGFVCEEEWRITQGWRRLQDIPTLGISVTEYPMPEVRSHWGA